MDDQDKDFFAEKSSSIGEAFALIDRLLDTAKPNAVYTDPIILGEYTVITASEVVATMGAGYGGGGGQSTGVQDSEGDSAGYGGGGGGGGFATSRPVAAISIGPDGTRVDPIIDPTKISIAFFTTFTAMIITLLQIFKFKNSKRFD